MSIIATINHEEIRNQVIDFNDAFSDEMRKLHTWCIKSASSDSRAATYLKESIRLSLIKFNKQFLNNKLADPIILEIFNNAWGLGPLTKYDTDDVDEIMVGKDRRISYEKRGKIYKTNDYFESDEHLLSVIRRLISANKSTDLSLTNPKVECERLNGDRITVTIPPISKYIELNIRKFDSFVPKTDSLISGGTITKEMVKELELLVRHKANIKVVGEMGSGKSTFLKWLIGFSPEDERVGILESDFELNPDKWHPNIDFVQLRERAGYTYPMLFQTMLRQNLKRVVVGEIRNGAEVFLYRYACVRGMSGSMASSHSTSAMDAIRDDAIEPDIQKTSKWKKGMLFYRGSG